MPDLDDKSQNLGPSENVKLEHHFDVLYQVCYDNNTCFKGKSSNNGGNSLNDIQSLDKILQLIDEHSLPNQNDYISAKSIYNVLKFLSDEKAIDMKTVYDMVKEICKQKINSPIKELIIKEH